MKMLRKLLCSLLFLFLIAVSGAGYASYLDQFTDNGSTIKARDEAVSREQWERDREQAAEEQHNKEQAQVQDETCNPVELQSGCKVVKEIDWDETILPLERKHRISQGSAWSLGAGWHLSIDSRIILGSALDNSAQITSSQGIVNDYDALINDAIAEVARLQAQVDALLEIDPDSPDYDPDAIAALETEMGDINAAVIPYQALLTAAQEKLDGYIDAKAYSDSREAISQQAIDNNYPVEYKIGVNYVKWVAPNGGRYIFNQGDNGLITSSDDHNNTLVLLEDGTAQVRTPEGIRYNYASNGLLMSATSRDGRSVTISRNAVNKPTLLADELGRYITFSYSGDRLSTVTDAVGRVTTYEYQDNKLTKVTQFDGQTHRYVYGYETEPLAITEKSDGEGNTWSYTYREQEDKTVVDIQTDAAGATFTYTYDFEGKSTTIEHRNGQTSVYLFNDNYRTISQTDNFDGSVLSYEYDDKGNRLSRTNQENEKESVTYNTFGEVLTVTNGA